MIPRKVAGNLQMNVRTLLISLSTPPTGILASSPYIIHDIMALIMRWIMGATDGRRMKSRTGSGNMGPASSWDTNLDIWRRRRQKEARGKQDDQARVRVQCETAISRTAFFTVRAWNDTCHRLKAWLVEQPQWGMRSSQQTHDQNGHLRWTISRSAREDTLPLNSIEMPTEMSTRVR